MVSQRLQFVMNPYLIPTWSAREGRKNPKTLPYDHLELWRRQERRGVSIGREDKKQKNYACFVYRVRSLSFNNLIIGSKKD